MARSHAQNVRRREIREFLNWYKERGKCSVRGCHVSFTGMPWLADFNHARGEKDFNISQAIVRYHSWEPVFKELSGVALVCSNHHREITFGALRASRRTPSIASVKRAWAEWSRQRSER